MLKCPGARPTFVLHRCAQAGAQAPPHSSSAQLEHEWHRLLAKLRVPNRALHEKWRALERPQCHPMFYARPGAIAPWERVLMP
jgi:hypothetical protein